MADNELGFEVSEIPRDLLPPDVTLARAPVSGAEAVSFKLIPLAPEPAPEPLPEPSPAPKRRRKAPAPAELPPADDRVSERIVERVIEIPIYQLSPVNEGEGHYLGILYALNKKAATDSILAQYEGKADDFIISEWDEGPRPFFIIHKASAGLPIEKESNATTNPAFPAEAPVEITPTTWHAKCPIDFSEWDVPVSSDSFLCPIDGTLLIRKEHEVKQ